MIKVRYAWKGHEKWKVLTKKECTSKRKKNMTEKRIDYGFVLRMWCRRKNYRNVMPT